MVLPGDFSRVALCIQLFSGQPLLRTPVKQERKCFSSDLGRYRQFWGQDI
jgi:hypothetical protein